MSGLIPAKLQKELTSIAKETNVELLLDWLTDTTASLLDNIATMAAIVRRLDELGVDYKWDNALLPYIRMVASGKLMGQCLVALSGDPLLLEQAIAAPIAVQERMASGDWFDVLMPDRSVRKVAALEMTKKEILQVFKQGHVRTREEQEAYLVAGSNKSVAQRQRLVGTRPSFVDPNYPDGREHLSEPEVGPRPNHSAMSVDLNWEAKKVVAAAVRWRSALKAADFNRDWEEACKRLEEAVDDYMENSKEGAAA